MGLRNPGQHDGPAQPTHRSLDAVPAHPFALALIPAALTAVVARATDRQVPCASVAAPDCPDREALIDSALPPAKGRDFS
jgi:hypothetical protein